MSKAKGKVVHLHERDPQEALERLNRITGLQFSQWPESLVPPAPVPEARREEDQEPPTPSNGAASA